MKIENLPSIQNYAVMNISNLNEVCDKTNGQFTDVLGKVTSSSKVKTTKTGKKYKTIILMDQFGTELNVTCWGNRPKIKTGTLVYIRDLKVYKPDEKDVSDGNDSDDDEKCSTHYYNVSQSSVIIEINDASQIPMKYRDVYSHFHTEETNEPKKKKRKVLNKD
jgi:hypothetical protein